MDLSWISNMLTKMGAIVYNHTLDGKQSKIGL